MTRIIRPNYSAQPAGHLIVLSCTSLSAIVYPTERVSTCHPFNLDRSCRAICSAYISRLGQWALVLKPRHQFDVWPIGDVDTAVGTSDGRPPTLQPPQASTYSCILQARCREAAYSLDHRSVASAAPNIPFPLPCRPFRLLVYCPSQYFQGSDHLDRCMRRFIRNPDVLDDYSQGQPLFCITFSIALFLSHRHTVSFLPSSSAVPKNRSLHHPQSISKDCPL